MKVLLAGLIGLCALGMGQAVVDVAVYYESLCGDSYRFVINQLNVYYDGLAENINLEFVPFGKSESVNGGESFICQHGPDECRLNMVQSCVLYNLATQDQQMDYVACQMAAPLVWASTGEACATAAGVSWQTVQACVTGGQGTELQLAAEVRQTKALGGFIAFVPTQVFNNQFDQTLQNRSLVEFQLVVCELLNFSSETCASLQP